MTACCASRRAIGRGGPRQPNAVADDTVALPFVACGVDQFDDAIPFVGEVDGCQDRESALSLKRMVPLMRCPVWKAPASLVEAMRAALPPQTEREPEEHTVIRP
jgi:hypothetical protein